MTKYKFKGNRDDAMYEDGYGVDRRKSTTIDKRKDRRFNRALKTKNVDALLEEDDEMLFDPWSNASIDDDGVDE